MLSTDETPTRSSPLSAPMSKGRTRGFGPSPTGSIGEERSSARGSTGPSWSPGKASTSRSRRSPRVRMIGFSATSFSPRAAGAAAWRQSFASGGVPGSRTARSRGDRSFAIVTKTSNPPGCGSRGCRGRTSELSGARSKPGARAARSRPSGCSGRRRTLAQSGRLRQPGTHAHKGRNPGDQVRCSVISDALGGLSGEFTDRRRGHRASRWDLPKAQRRPHV